MKLTTYNPIADLDCFFNPDNFLTQQFPFSGSTVQPQEPRVNIRDEGDEFLIEASVAGYDNDEIQLEVKENTLTLAGDKNETKETNKNGYHMREFSCAKFKRHFNLGEEVEQDNISAKVEKGILTVHLPKKEKVQPKKIPITLN